MAVRINNPKGFLVIMMKPYEAAIYCHFGCKLPEDNGYYLICDNCNNILDGFPFNVPVYYVAVLNKIFCDKCYAEWISNATRYDEDIPYETAHFNKYAKLLDLK